MIYLVPEGVVIWTSDNVDDRLLHQGIHHPELIQRLLLLTDVLNGLVGAAHDLEIVQGRPDLLNVNIRVCDGPLAFETLQLEV